MTEAELYNRKKYRKKYKKRNCEPRPCTICGKVFTPPHGNRKLCTDCKERVYRNLGRDWAITYEGPTNVIDYERNLEKRNRERYCDTIVAIGYADRQMAASLKMAGKVNTEL